MSIHIPLLGLLGTISGVLAIVATQRIDPFYTWLLEIIPSIKIQYTPRIKALYSARQTVGDGGAIRIRQGHRGDLQTIHQILIDEFGFDEQYYPIELNFLHNAIKIEYAEGRTQGRRNVTREDLISMLDSRISEIIGKVAAWAGIIAVLAFAVLILLAVI